MDPMMNSMEDVIYSPEGYPLYPDFATRKAVGNLRPEDVAYLVFEKPYVGFEPMKVTDEVFIARIIHALQNAYTEEPTFTDPFFLDTLEIFVKTVSEPRRVALFRFGAGSVSDLGPEFKSVTDELGWVGD